MWQAIKQFAACESVFSALNALAFIWMIKWLTRKYMFAGADAHRLLMLANLEYVEQELSPLAS